jgi:4-amino-4-deoxy-L-arabinose transferase-like glycosyltransferase
MTAVVILVVGALIHMFADSGFKGMGFDEALYRKYILMIDKGGFIEYPSICESYTIDQQRPESIAKLPPTRFLYIFCGWLAKSIAFGDAPPVGNRTPSATDHDPALVSLHRVSLIFSILTVGLCGLAAWRMAGPGIGLGVMALVAASPIAIHMGERALVDGFFAFWATLCLWLLWENLRNPKDPRWLVALTAALALLVMTKENSFFVYVGLCGCVVINRWTKFGVVTRPLLLAGILGPLLGVAVLVVLAGGFGAFVEIYKLLAAKAQNLDYAIAREDGPWFRYIIELIVFDPIVFVLALTGLFTLPRKDPSYGFLLAFVVFSYAIMCNVRYGMNVRFTTIWALPIATFAVAQIVYLSEFARRYAVATASMLVAGICVFNLFQYNVFFVENPIYEPVPPAYLRAIKLLKEMPKR